MDDAAVGGEIRVTISDGRKNGFHSPSQHAFALGTAANHIVSEECDFEIGTGATSKRRDKKRRRCGKDFAGGSSSKAKPWASRPRTFSGRRTAILRSERCFETVGARERDHGLGPRFWRLRPCRSQRFWRLQLDRVRRFPDRSGPALEKAFDAFENFRGCARRMYRPRSSLPFPTP